MPPKAASKKAAAPAPSAPKKAAATAAKKSTAATTKKTTAAAATKAAAKPAAKPAKTVAKPAAKPAAAPSKKRKAEEEEEEDEDKENIPKTKKSKTAVTKEAPKAKAAPKKETKPAAAASTKRKTDKETDEASVPKKQKKAAVPRARTPAPAAAARHPHHIGPKINDAPTKILDVYVFGEGTSGELGLGSKKVDNKKPIDVKRPRLNANLDATTVGVVQVSVGGMHAAALTRDNKILTWGVNDQGALGRSTDWSGGLRDMDATSDSGSEDDEDDTGMNPMESTPTAVSAEYFAAGAKFVQVVTGDSATFVLTEDGRVYGWGTFRSNDGILGFSSKVHVQKYPAFISELKNIKALAAGSNHVLALDHKGNILAWGCGQQNQLGRRIIERNKLASLIPQGMALPTKKIEKIACGQYHNFAIDTDGKVWTWGLNNFGETGIREGAGEDEAVILRPVLVDSLDKYRIVDIAGGQHHSLACSEDGKLLTWGRFDGYQVGFAEADVNEDDLIRDEHKKPRILAVPTVVPTVQDVLRVSAGTDNSFAVTKDGKAYSWGFSGNYQTGQGTTDDIEAPTLIDNTAVRGKQIVWAGAGGQYSILAGEASS